MKNKYVFYIYGKEDGEITHRQRESFFSSYKFTDLYGIDYDVNNCDITHTNAYTQLIIHAKTYKQAYCALFAQLSDGIFENSAHGKVIYSKGLINKEIF